MQNQHADEHRRAGHQAAVEREPVVHRVERGEDVGSQDVRGLPADEDRRRADALQMSRAFRLSVSVSDERTYRHDGGRGGRRTTISEDEIDCRIEYNDSIVIGPQGEEFASSGRIFCEADMKCGDLLGIEGRDFSIIKINPSFSFDGVHVINEVYFQ